MAMRISSCFDISVPHHPHFMKQVHLHDQQ